MDQRLEQQIAFIITLDQLKNIQRRSYLISGDRNENSAEHSWHIALMVMLLAEYSNASIDLERTIRMLLVHDIVEIEAGDTYCYDDVVDQTLREEKAADRLFNMLPDDQAEMVRDLWDEFESGDSPESRFAAAMDRLMPLLQSYHTQGKGWKENEINKSQVLERNGPIVDGSNSLWKYAENLIDDAAEKGWLN
jgi:putative hydrolase of HD superfamily